MTHQIKPVPLPNDVDAHYLGLPFGLGKMAAVFYFFTTAHDSLSLDPFCKPIDTLNTNKLRAFSVTLPFHTNAPPLPENSIEQWNKENLFPFLDRVKNLIDALVDEEVIDPENIAFMGLSRGSFIALHLARLYPQVKAVCSFAPMTALKSDPQIDIDHFVKDLYTINWRVYMGNRDKKTSTKRAVDFILSLADYAYDQGIRSAPIEMIISPSIGASGHGTPPHTFEAGAKWVETIIVNDDE